MDQKTYSISMTLGHQGRSVKHNRSISKLIRESVLPEVYKSRNEWLALLRPMIDHKESKHIVSNQIFFDGHTFTEIIRLYPPHSSRPELSLFLYTHGILDFAEAQLPIEYRDLSRQLHEYMPAANFKMSVEHHSEVTDCFEALLKAAKEMHLDFRVGGVVSTKGDAEGITLSFRETTLKQTSVKFGAVIVPLGRPGFTVPKS